MNEEQIKAAKAAWQRDPDTAAQALLGMSAEEVFVQALKGCNQHAHKPGCPDANGSGMSDEDLAAELRGVLGEMTGGRPVSSFSREKRGEIEHVMNQIKEVESRIKKNSKPANPQLSKLNSLINEAKSKGETFKISYKDEKGKDTRDEGKARTAEVWLYPNKKAGESFDPNKHDAARIWKLLKDAGLQVNDKNVSILNLDTNKQYGKSKTRIIRGRGNVAIQFPLN